MERRTIDIVVTILGAVAVIGPIVGGVLLLVASNFAKDQVTTELAAQKVFFPPKGSPALDPKEFPGLQQYARVSRRLAPPAGAGRG